MAKQWIREALNKTSALNKQLKVPIGKIAPMDILQSAAKKSGKLGKRARIALTLQKLNKE